MFTEVFQAVILANMLTLAVAYGMRRIIHDEWDLRGVLWAVVPLLAIAALAYRPL